MNCAVILPKFCIVALWCRPFIKLLYLRLKARDQPLTAPPPPALQPKLQASWLVESAAAAALNGARKQTAAQGTAAQGSDF